MALLFPLVIVAIIVVLFLQHRGRDTGARRYLDAVEADMASWLDEGETDRLAAPDQSPPSLPHHLQHAVTAAYDARARGRPDSADLARRAIGAIAEYREFRGWKG